MIQRSVRYLAWAHARKLTGMLDDMFRYDCIWCFEHEKALLKKRFTSVFYTQCVGHGAGLGIALFEGRGKFRMPICLRQTTPLRRWSRIKYHFLKAS